MPVSPFRLFLLVFVAVFVAAFVQVGIISIAFDKLGLSPNSALQLLFALLIGGTINIPLFRIRADPPPPDMEPLPYQGLFPFLHRRFTGKTVVAVNVGGCLVPMAFSVYLFAHEGIDLLQALLAVATVAAVSYKLSRPLPGIGIAMPMLVAPLVAALVAVLLDPARSAPLAYIGGTLGVIVGADIMHLNEVRKIGTPFASIGGGGTFDGIFITGVVAVLLA